MKTGRIFRPFLFICRIMSAQSRKKYFRMVAHAEGISFVVLLFIAMPLKYLFEMPQAVSVMGWMHGILFIWYLSVITVYGTEHYWHTGIKLRAVVAGLLPMGTFWFTAKFLPQGNQ